MNFNFMIGGEAGQGVQSMGYILAKSLAKGGYSVLASQDYESRIRGGHNFFAVRVGDSLVHAVSEEVNLLIALNEETIKLHRGELTEDGLILYDGEGSKTAVVESALVSVPFERLAVERTGSRIMGNTVALGAALRLVHYDVEILAAVLRKTFGKKGREVAEKNVDAARAGYDFLQEHGPPSFEYRLAPVGMSRQMVINGGEAVAVAALAAGCKFVSGYPMTPSTGILQYFAGQAEAFNVVFEQAEDEIAALNMVLGASYAGVRAMTATSGGGFSLMVESLSLAGMTETPAVIVLGQRVGPATGFPTRTEQGELEFAVHAGHGMFPRVVFAPGTVEEAFNLTVKAFNLAEQYQVPVILLTDTYLSDTYATAEFDLSQVTVERGDFLSEEEVHALGKYQYMRHKLTPSGVSPRVIPGQAAALVVTDSDEHTEDGHITESAEVRRQMVQKRLNKMQGLRKEIGAPLTYGPAEAETVLMGWGSTYGALREAVDRLNNATAAVRMIHMSEIWPFPRTAFMTAIQGFHRLIVVEGNATGQMAHLIRAETGVDATGNILRYDGRPLTPAYVATKFQEEVKA